MKPWNVILLSSLLPPLSSLRSRAFALLEVLVVIVVLGLLAALLLPALGRSRIAAQRVQCLSNQRQLALAGQLYWDEHEGNSFPYRGAATNGGDVYWFGWLQRGPEGTRAFDQSQGALAPYLGPANVGLCPGLNYALSNFKRKAVGAAYGYGYNLHLSSPAGSPPVNVARLPRPSSTAFLADAAQVNDFQPPASPEHPMLEEFYYVNTGEPTAHFRHARKANVVFLDGHAGAEDWVPGSLDRKLPGHHVARLRPEILDTAHP